MKFARCCMLAAVWALAVSTGAAAQALPSPPDSPKPPQKSAAPAKPKKPAPAKTADEKKKADAAERKLLAKKAAPRKAEPKVYTTGPRQLRDKDGHVIPTSPEAYNVDSAMPPKPRK